VHLCCWLIIAPLYDAAESEDRLRLHDDEGALSDGLYSATREKRGERLARAALADKTEKSDSWAMKYLRGTSPWRFSLQPGDSVVVPSGSAFACRTHEASGDANSFYGSLALSVALVDSACAHRAHLRALVMEKTPHIQRTISGDVTLSSAIPKDYDGAPKGVPLPENITPKGDAINLAATLPSRAPAAAYQGQYHDAGSTANVENDDTPHGADLSHTLTISATRVPPPEPLRCRQAPAGRGTCGEAQKGHRARGRRERQCAAPESAMIAIHAQARCFLIPAGKLPQQSPRAGQPPWWGSR
jgi:hypothetical protein